MDSEKCRALVTAEELGSMPAAAQQLGYTASGITRMINALEAELGITLIARTSRSVALTSDGVALEPFLRELALTAERARQQAAAAKGLLEGEISVASYSSTAATWLPNILRAFQSSHPGVRMRTMEAGNEQLVSWVEQHTIDCAIFAKRPFRGDWIPPATRPAGGMVARRPPARARRRIPPTRTRKRPIRGNKPAPEHRHLAAAGRRRTASRRALHHHQQLHLILHGGSGAGHQHQQQADGAKLARQRGGIAVRPTALRGAGHRRALACPRVAGNARVHKLHEANGE